MTALRHICFCGAVGVRMKYGKDWVCARCDRIEADLHEHEDSFTLRGNARGLDARRVMPALHTVVFPSQTCRRHFAYDMEIVR